MSFTSTVKNEILETIDNKIVNYPFLSAVIINSTYTKSSIKIVTENIKLANKIFRLIKELYAIHPIITVRKGYNYNNNYLYIIEIKENIINILEDIGLFDTKLLTIPKQYIIDDEEQLKSYLKGLFLMTGSINDPKTSRYHLEFVVQSETYAHFINSILKNYDLNSKVLKRESKYMVYIKESERISDFLKLITATNSLLYYEDIRIYRDYKNMTNRLNNCEQANTERMMESANNQLKDIKLIESIDINLLDEKEQIAATYRKKYEDASLTELSEIISYETGNKITKSGLSHRFKKIEQLAAKIRKNQSKE